MENQKLQEKIGIGVVGLPGSGKSIVSEVAAEFGIPTIVMGDIIRKLCADKGLEINSSNIGTCMKEIRKDEGMNAVAKRTLPKIAEIKERMLIIDGLRSYEEVELYRKVLKRFIVVGIHASPQTRYKRIKERNRDDDTLGFGGFEQRDAREIATGIAKIIALADLMIINEESIETVKMNVKEILKSLIDDKAR